MPLLETRDLCKSFGGLQATRDVALSIDAGEIRGLIGPNGAGKTTLANLITGIYAPDSGDVRLRGERIDGTRPSRVARAGIARTFQNTRLFGSLSARKNLLVSYDAVSGSALVSPAAARERAGHLLELSRLAAVADLPAAALSGGQRALLQLSCGFMHPRLALYVLDEPFAGINPVFIETILELLSHHRQHNEVAYLIVSHEMEIMRRICDRVTVMIDGAIYFEGTLAEAAANEGVIDAYLGRPV
ncbi:MAG: ABC transporter ATP-binding protein [Candidatus Eremiobacteraeota bacterium]|nr:ABC transporter ATP-binding protein [Candidatus Eremiobacteraeota bacterium]